MLVLQTVQGIKRLTGPDAANILPTFYMTSKGSQQHLQGFLTRKGARGWCRRRSNQRLRCQAEV